MFTAFGAAHICALLATVLAAAALAALSRRLPPDGFKRYIARPLALLLVLNELGWHVFLVRSEEWNTAEHLPLHLCDVGLFVSAVALLSNAALPFELAYFWGLGGAVQALLTPALTAPFPDYEFLRFFVAHAGIVVAVSCLAFGRRRRPRVGAARRAIIITGCYAATVGLVNALIGSNYLYLCRPPSRASLIDFLGPWPWYIGPLAALGVATILLLYLPYWLKRDSSSSSFDA